MMSENSDSEAIAKGPKSDDSSARERTESTSSSSSGSGIQRSYSQRFSLTTTQPYLVPDERLNQLKDRKLLMDIMFEDLVTVSWLLGITPKSAPIVDEASYYFRSCVCSPCYVLSRGLTLLTCFISDSSPGTLMICLHWLCQLMHLLCIVFHFLFPIFYYICFHFL